MRSKLSGARQVLAVARGTYSRPIPSPVHELRPARETCEQCHWPQKFHGDKLVVRTKFSDDEANTRIDHGAHAEDRRPSGLGSTGIHGRHLDDTDRIRYVSTGGRRQVIPRVSYLDDSGKTIEYVSDGSEPRRPRARTVEHRSMDCMDCHNRPTHAFQLPERAVDRALAEGRISPELPFVQARRRWRLLRAEYPDRETAGRGIVETARRVLSDRPPGRLPRPPRPRRRGHRAGARHLPAQRLP